MSLLNWDEGPAFKTRAAGVIWSAAYENVLYEIVRREDGWFELLRNSAFIGSASSAAQCSLQATREVMARWSA